MCDAGVDGESVLKYQSQGDAGLHGGQPGDLYLTFVINPREGINRMGLDIFSEVVLACAWQYVIGIW